MELGEAGLRAEALKNATEAEEARKSVFKAAVTNQIIHYVIGLATVTAAALSAFYAQGDSLGTARWTALAATVLAAAQAFLDEGKRANSQYERAAGLLGVAKRFRAFAVGAQEPTDLRKQFGDIVSRWEEVHRPSVK